MIRIAVCDDDQVFISEIMKPLLIKALTEVRLKSEIVYFSNGKALINDFCRKGFDIVILDIDMPVINGKELTKELRKIDSKFHLAFMSAYKEEAYGVIPYQVDAFIPKEFDFNKCLDCLSEFFKKYISSTHQTALFNIIIDGYNSAVKLYLDDIYYFGNLKGSIFLYTEKEKYLLRERSLKKIINTFENTGLVRACPSIIVNVNKVYEVFDSEIALINGIRLPISRRNKKVILTEMANNISTKVVV